MKPVFSTILVLQVTNIVNGGVPSLGRCPNVRGEYYFCLVHGSSCVSLFQALRISTRAATSGHGTSTQTCLSFIRLAPSVWGRPTQTRGTESESSMSKSMQCSALLTMFLLLLIIFLSQNRELWKCEGEREICEQWRTSRVDCGLWRNSLWVSSLASKYVVISVCQLVTETGAALPTTSWWRLTTPPTPLSTPARRSFSSERKVNCEFTFA